MISRRRLLEQPFIEHAAKMAPLKANVLLVGGGAVGSIAAVNIEAGGLGTVTLVARSNYVHISEKGYDIESVDHGKLHGWKPTSSAFMSLRILLSYY